MWPRGNLTGTCACGEVNVVDGFAIVSSLPTTCLSQFLLKFLSNFLLRRLLLALSLGFEQFRVASC